MLHKDVIDYMDHISSIILIQEMLLIVLNWRGETLAHFIIGMCK